MSDHGKEAMTISMAAFCCKACGRNVVTASDDLEARAGLCGRCLRRIERTGKP